MVEMADEYFCRKAKGDWVVRTTSIQGAGLKLGFSESFSDKIINFSDSQIQKLHGSIGSVQSIRAQNHRNPRRTFAFKPPQPVGSSAVPSHTS